MDLTNIIIINTVGLILTGIVLFGYKKGIKLVAIDNKLFYYLTLSVMALLIIEVLSYVFNKTTFPGAIFLNRLSNSMLYWSDQIPGLIWALYVDFFVYKNSKRLKKIFPYLLIPAIIVFILSSITLFTDFLFIVDENNVYHRTSLLFIPLAIDLVYLFYATIIIIKNKNTIRNKDFIPMLMFMILPVIGIIIQMIFYTVSLIWVFASLALTNVYVNVQLNISSTDTLTNLFNRRALEKYLTVEVKKLNDTSNLLCGLMLDVDKFKTINDKYGHVIGDDALENVGNILNKCTKPNDFVSRYGGDEFVIILHCKNVDEIFSSMKTIIKKANEFNKTKNKQYQLSFSIGYSIFDGKRIKTIDDFLKQMDKNMYIEKNKKKSIDSKID